MKKSAAAVWQNISTICTIYILTENNLETAVETYTNFLVRCACHWT